MSAGQPRAPVFARALRKGDRVAVLSPASPLPKRRNVDLDRGLDRLRGYGLVPVLMPHARATTPKFDYLAGDDEDRLADLQAAFDDPEYRGVFCLRGGYGVTRLLPNIDWTGLRRDPKVVIGYSDPTALLAAMWHELGLVGFHGPMVATAESHALGPACSEQQRLLTHQTVDAAALPTEISGPTPHVLRSGKSVRGRLVGGNLSLVSALLGTRWQIDTTDAIVFLEDVSEPPYSVDRLLTQLHQAGCFARAAAVVLGDFHMEDTPLTSEYPPISEVLNERLSDLDIPVAMGFPFGHRPESWTLPFGGLAQLDAEDIGSTPRLRLLEPSVRKP